MQVLVELLDVVVFVLVETHLDAHEKRTAAVRLDELLLLIDDGVLVYELLESPVVRLGEPIHRVLHVDLFVLIVHDREHHLDFHRLVRHVLEEYA